MSRNTEPRTHTIDPLDSAAALVKGFLGSLVVATIAIGSGTTDQKWLWFAVLQVVVALASSTGGRGAALYNGIVCGLFFNFIVSPERQLAFDSVSSVIFEASFIVAAVAASGWGRRFSVRSRVEGDRRSTTAISSFDVAQELPSFHSRRGA